MMRGRKRLPDSALFDQLSEIKALSLRVYMIIILVSGHFPFIQYFKMQD